MKHTVLACLPVVLSLHGCFLEVSGCSENACVSVSEGECNGKPCAEPVNCEDQSLIQQRMTELVSTARERARACGNIQFSAADEVFWNSSLAQAAAQHAVDMAEHNFFSHTGSDGSSVADRTTEAGYEFRLVAENIAAGQESATTVVTDWLSSPEHCSNLMNPALREIGAACRSRPSSDFQTYWTLVLGVR